MKKVKRNNNFYNETEQLAKLHSKLFNINEDEALLHILNSNDYNYKGYYDEYGNLKPDKNNHFADKYKTAFHNTFSNESIYSGKKSQYNPLGIVGGYWDENDNFIQSDDMKKIIKHKNGGSTQFKCGGMKRVPRKKAFLGALFSYIQGKEQMRQQDEQFEQQMALQKEQIKKQEIYNDIQNEIQTQNVLQSNNNMYDSLRGTRLKCGGKIKRKKAVNGMLSTIAPLNINPIQMPTIKVNIPSFSGGGFDLGTAYNIFSQISQATDQVVGNVMNMDVNQNKFNNDMKLQKEINEAQNTSSYFGLNPERISSKTAIDNIKENNTYNTYNTQLNELQKRRRGQLNSLYLN